MTRRFYVVGSVVLSVILGACGGGGGGGGGGVGLGSLPIVANGQPATADADGSAPANPLVPGSPPPSGANFTTVNLSIESVTNAMAPGHPMTIAGTYYEKETVADVVLVGTAVGDFSVMSGKPLYVIIEDPAGLFRPNAQAMPITSPKPGLMVPLYGAQLEKTGHLVGALRIYVCLDARCSIRLGNVPYSIPYDIIVKRDLRVEIDKRYATVNVPFPDRTMHVVSAVAETPPILTARITPPEGRPVSSLKASVDTASNVDADAKISDNGDGTATLSISVAAPFKRPGNYHADITVGSDIPRPAADDPTYKEARTKSLTVSYDVRPLIENSPAVFSPPILEMTISSSELTAELAAGPLGERAVPFAYSGVAANSLNFGSTIEWVQPFPELVPKDPQSQPYYSYISGGNKYYVGSDYLDVVNYRRCAYGANTSPPICLSVGTHSFRLSYTYIRPDGIQATGYYTGWIIVTP